MSESENAGFGKFVPGFDFLQNLAKGATPTVPQMPNLSSWVAPSLNEEELDKRIAELKAVHFWLDQNSKALAATVQALEVQKMTLATLKGMNFNISDVANAFKLKAADAVPSGVQKEAEKAEAPAKTVADVAGQAEEVAKKGTKTAKPAAAAAAGMVDPMQLWTALTQQFQQIAAGAMKEASKVTSGDTVTAAKKSAGKKVAAKKAPAKAAGKVAAKTSARNR
ncbi:MAG: hypothetical protein RL300_1071 [Pseudomonadota bacterium]